VTTVHTGVPLEPMTRDVKRTVEALPQTPAEAVAPLAVPPRAAAGRTREGQTRTQAIPGVIGALLQLPGAAIRAVGPLVPPTLGPGPRGHRVRTAPVHRAQVGVRAQIVARVRRQRHTVLGHARAAPAQTIVRVVRVVAVSVAGVPAVIVRVVRVVAVSVAVRVAVASIGIAVRASIGQSAGLTRLTSRKRSWPRNWTRTPGAA